jgi:hypothetical protein
VIVGRVVGGCVPVIIGHLAAVGGAVVAGEAHSAEPGTRFGPIQPVQKRDAPEREPHDRPEGVIIDLNAYDNLKARNNPGGT